jgi:hypothetical protein
MHQKMNSEAWDELWGMRWMLWCSSWWDPFCIKGFAVSPALKKFVRESERVSELKADLSSQAVCFLDLSLREYLFVFCWGLGTCNNHPMLQQELFCIRGEQALYASERPHECYSQRLWVFKLSQNLLGNYTTETNMSPTYCLFIRGTTKSKKNLIFQWVVVKPHHKNQNPSRFCILERRGLLKPHHNPF